MSTDIKPGQAWQWDSALPHEGGIVVTKIESGNVHYRYEDESIGGEHYRDTEHFTERAHLVTDATPAPIDPSKTPGGPFAGGDSVRYVGPPHRSYTAVGIIPDRVYTVRDGTNVENGVISLYGSSGMFPAIKFELVSRAAHQPTPEPEPEWKPGTTGTATLNNRVTGNSTAGLRAMRTGSREARPGFALENGMSISDDATTYSVSDFVPDASRDAVTAEMERLELAGTKAERERDQWRQKCEQSEAASHLVQADLTDAQDTYEAAYRAAAPDLAMEDRTESLAVVVERLRKVAETPWPTREQIAEIARAKFGGPNEAWLDFGDAVLALLRGGAR